jgi:beta-N-acetylhexosaminidase
MKTMLKLFTFLLIIILNIGVSAQNHVPRFMEANTAWADSILKTMTLEEKIGQLIMVTAYSQLGESDEKVILSQIAQQKIGGVLFLKSSPHRLAELTRKYQEASMVPLFIAIDAENGLSFRMDSVVEYPHLIGLGAMQSDSMLYIMGREIGRQCKTLGINLNFGPVADVNCNPGNPIISYRSFGESPEKVAQRSWLLAKGMQDENILVTLKHFPGHGDTSFDSHLKIASVEHRYSRLDSIELIPFRYGIKNGINGS